MTDPIYEQANIDGTWDRVVLSPQARTDYWRIMRQSLLGSAEDCMRKAEFSLDPNITIKVGSPSRIRGTAYHAGLEWLYRHPNASAFTANLQAQNSITEQIEHEYDEIQWAGETEEGVREQVTEMVAWYMSPGNRPNLWLPDNGIDIRQVEFEFALPHPVTGWELRGTMDLAVEERMMGTVLVDHKTAGRRWPESKSSVRKLPQAGIYAYAWKQIFGLWPDWFVFDIMTIKAQFQRVWVPINPDEVMVVMDRTIELARTIDTLSKEGIHLPANPGSNLCSEKYCDYWSICPYGAAHIKEDSNG